jgi:hypothetical protein
MSTWLDIEAALQNAVEVATGLDDAHVIFAEQNGPQPTRPFITLRLSDTSSRGEFVTHQHDAVADELVFTAYSHRELVVSIQAFTSGTTGNTARAMLESLRLKLLLPAAREALRAVGVTPFSASSVQNLTALGENEADYLGRALLEVRCEVVQTLEERVPYIRTVEVTNENTGQTYDVALP